MRKNLFVASALIMLMILFLLGISNINQNVPLQLPPELRATAESILIDSRLPSLVSQTRPQAGTSLKLIDYQYVCAGIDTSRIEGENDLSWFDLNFDFALFVDGTQIPIDSNISNSINRYEFGVCAQPSLSIGLHLVELRLTSERLPESITATWAFELE